MAVLPGYVRDQLGCDSVMAGLAVSVQYAAALLSRSHAGRMSDTIGPKRTVLIGQAVGAVGGVLLLMAYAFERSPGFSLGVLLVSRLCLGFAESWISTSGITWGMGRVGVQHTARVISWNGIATYGGPGRRRAAGRAPGWRVQLRRGGSGGAGAETSRAWR